MMQAPLLGSVLSAPKWMDDNESSVCLLCSKEFSFTNRRHHCRTCYRLTCASCSTRSATFEGKKKERISGTRSFLIASRQILQGGRLPTGLVEGQSSDAPPSALGGSSSGLGSSTALGGSSSLNSSSEGVVKERVCDDCWSASPESKSRVVWRRSLDRRVTRFDLSFADEAMGDFFVVAVAFEGVSAGVAAVNGGSVRVEMPRLTRPGARYAVATLLAVVPSSSSGGALETAFVGSPSSTSLKKDRESVDDAAAFGSCRIPLTGAKVAERTLEILTPAGDRSGFALTAKVVLVLDEEEDDDEDDGASLPPLYRDGRVLETSPPWPPPLRGVFSPDDVPPALACDDVDLPRGERLLEIFDDVRRGDDRKPGSLLVTTHRLVFLPPQQRQSSSSSQRRRRRPRPQEGVVSVPHACVLDAGVKVASNDGLSLRLALYDFAVETFTSPTVAHRDWLWCKREIAWRAREDQFATSEEEEYDVLAFGTSPSKTTLRKELLLPEAETPPPIGMDEDDEEETCLPAAAAATASATRAEKRRALQRFLKKQSSSRDTPTTPSTALPSLLLADLRRIGVLDDHRWRLSAANDAYELCPTYPRRLVVPSAVSDDDLYAAAKWRSKGRIPALVWYHRKTGAPLCRASQPLAGLGSTSCYEDEKLLMHLRAATARTTAALSGERRSSFAEVDDTFDDPGVDVNAPKKKTADRSVVAPPLSASSRKKTKTKKKKKKKKKTPVLRILDARPLLNAKANAALGKGHEDVSRLGGKDSASLAFLNVANIHVMHDSFRTLREALLAGATPDTYTSQLGLPEDGDDDDDEGDDDDFSLQRREKEEEENDDAAGASPPTTDDDDDDDGLHPRAEAPQEASVFKALHDSRWLQHVAAVLRGAATVAASLRRGDPVLLHCSDGWDRTSQVSAVAQFLLDPHYRTILGFRALVEKEFGAFGFMFRERSGLPASLVHAFGGSERSPTAATGALAAALQRSAATTTLPATTNEGLDLVFQYQQDQLQHATTLHETSPVFAQFLDAIFQITAQFPDVAEFDDRLLAFLWRHAHARYFGDFLRDCEKQRLDDREEKNNKAVSLWRYVDHNRRRFTNVLYEPSATAPLVPNCSLRALQLCPMYLPTDAVPRTIAVLRRRLAKAEKNKRQSKRTTDNDVAPPHPRREDHSPDDAAIAMRSSPR